MTAGSHAGRSPTRWSAPSNGATNLDARRGLRGLRRRHRVDRPSSATSEASSDAVLRLSFDRLTKGVAAQDRRRTRGSEPSSSFIHGGAAGERGTKSVAAAVRGRQGPRHLRRAHRRRPRGRQTARVRPPVTSTTRFAPRSAGSTPKRPHGWWPSMGSDKVGMVFGELAGGEVNVRIWIHPAYRKQGYGTAALRSRVRRWPRTSLRPRWWCGHPRRGPVGA